jgi:hypothetical protein
LLQKEGYKYLELRTMNNKFIGSSFDDFLEDEGLLAEVEAKAIKRVIAFQISFV